jgi:predicted metal-dependent peptidase
MHPSLQTHRGTLAVQKMVEYAPSTGGLALWVKHCDVEALPALATPGVAASASQSPLSAANDGRTIFYTPAFEALPLPRQIGQVAHQVLHIALRHAQRAQALQRLLGQLDHELFNVCADAIVNSTLGHLSWLELPPDWVTLEGLLSSVLHREQSPPAALLEWDLERLYRTIDDRRFRHGAGGRGSSASGRSADRPGHRSEQNAADDEQSLGEIGAVSEAEDGPRASRVRWLGENTPRDLLPADSDSRPEREAEEAREWRERLIRAHAGDGAHSMLRELIADLPRVRTPWEHLLRTLLTRGLARSPDQSWSRPARSYIANQGRSASGRRMPWEPGKSASRAVPRLVVMVDLSGSIEPALLERFAGEIEAMSRRLEAGLTIVAGDCRVSGVAHFEPGLSNLRELSFDGGGGTDFAPLLKEAERHAPDIGVFLTDLDGPADYKPGFPVIWAVPAASAEMRHPFGRKLVLE